MQKILECVEVQVKVIKKIISHLSKKEEEDLKEEEEDEEDKADYRQSELAQENIDRMMTERKVCLLPPKFMPQLKSTPRPWTFKRAHVNCFSELGDAGVRKTNVCIAYKIYAVEN